MTAPAATPSVDDILAAKKRHTESVSLRIDEDHVETFTFQALGKEELRDLRLDPRHRPTAEQKRQFKDEQKDAGVPSHRIIPLSQNPDTFPAALLATTCVSHGWSEEDWIQLLTSDRFSEREIEDLTAGAIAAQTKRTVVDPEA